MSAATSLVSKRVISAKAERLFDAWVEPAQLRAWWGPRGVTCVEAEVDARVGGRYALANALPDGEVIWIRGEFLEVDRPRRLVYTWSEDDDTGPFERVTVSFEERGDRTEVIVLHERIQSARVREQHAEGWDGCLDRLAEHLAG